MAYCNQLRRMLFAAVFFAEVFRATKAEREPQAEDGVIENRKPFGKKLMWISFMGFAVITLYYGPLIYRSAHPGILMKRNIKEA